MPALSQFVGAQVLPGHYDHFRDIMTLETFDDFSLNLSEIGSSPTVNPPINWGSQFEFGSTFSNFLYTPGPDSITFATNSLYIDDFDVPLKQDVKDEPQIEPVILPQIKPIPRSRSATPKKLKFLTFHPFESCYSTEYAVQSIKRAFSPKL